MVSPRWDQHLVDDDLEEERSHEGEELQEERNEEHLAEQPAVLHHGRDEPGEIELALRTREHGTPGQEHEPSGPPRPELLDTQQQGRPDAFLHQHPVIVGTRQHDEPPAAHLGDGGERKPGQAAGRRLHRARLQAQAACRPHQVQHLHRAFRRGMLAGDLPRVGRQTMKPEHDREACCRGVDVLRAGTGTMRRYRLRSAGRRSVTGLPLHRPRICGCRHGSADPGTR